jgi:virginiamycin B lyase
MKRSRRWERDTGLEGEHLGEARSIMRLRDMLIAISGLTSLLFLPDGAIAKQIREFSELKPSAILHLEKTADWVAITADAVWVGGTSPYAVDRIDPLTNQRVATVLLPGEPCSDFAVGFGSLWVPLCKPAQGLAKIDVASNRLAQIFKVGPVEPEASITVSADSVWMTVGKDGAVERIDPATGAVRQTVRVPAGSYNVLYSDGRIWITNPKEGEVSIIDAVTGKPLGAAPAGPGARWQTVGAGAIWILNEDGSLTRVETQHGSSRTVDLGMPKGGAYIQFGAGMLWTSTMKTPLSLIDPTSPTLLCQWNGKGGDALGIGFGAIWLTDYHAGTIARFPVEEALRHCHAQ